MSRAVTDEWRAQVVQAVVQRKAETGQSPTLGELAAVLGWTGDAENYRKNVSLLVTRGQLAVTKTIPRRVLVTSIGAQLLKAGAQP